MDDQAILVGGSASNSFFEPDRSCVLRETNYRLGNLHGVYSFCASPSIRAV